MRIAVLCQPASWYLRDLQRAAVALGWSIEPAEFAALHTDFGGSGEETIAAGDLRLDRCDAVLVRTMPPGSLEQVVFRMDALARLEAAGVTVVNRPKAVEAAVDKYLTSVRLAAAGLPTPRTIVCQRADDALRAFAALGGDVVVKPLFGGEGRGLARITDDALALRAFRLLEQLGAVLYVQEFIPHEGADVRVLVVGERLFGMRRVNRLDWRTNVSRGARPEPFALTDETARLARAAAAAVEASVAGVDLLPAADGRWQVLEVNAVPGWQALGRTLDVDIARCVLEHVGELVAARQRTLA